MTPPRPHTGRPAGDDVAMPALSQRLEMLLVLRWLEAGADDRAEVSVSPSQVAEEMGLGPERSDLLRLMAALGELEERGVVRVSWPGGGGEMLVELSDDLRRDAQSLFRG